MVEHSVLIHAYNHAPFIAECVDSVLAQTSPPAEIIVHDGGSTDGTLSILQRYGDRIRLIRGERRDDSPPQAEARAVQAGFAISHGELVFLLDGGDRFKPEKIARYTAAFQNHPDASIVQAPLERIDHTGRPVSVALEPRFHVYNHLGQIYRRHDVNFFYPTSALAFSRYYLERILPLDLSDGLALWADARLCAPAAYYGRIVTLLDPLTDWRGHGAADHTGIHPRSIQIEQVFMRAQVFNAFCRHHRLRPISPWRNRRLYLHLARYVTPPLMFERCARWARALLEWAA